MRGNRKVMIKSFVLLVSILLSLIGESTNVQAVENTSISISGLKIGDCVEIYRIASYKESEQGYVWEGTVADWIQNKEEGKSINVNIKMYKSSKIKMYKFSNCLP